MRWSPPEQNASVPAPVRMTTPIFGSSRATSNALDISNTVVGRNALRTSGRLIVILAMPSHVSYTMSSYWPARLQVPLTRVARPFKLALLEQSLALFEIVRRGRSAALEHQPGTEADQHQPRQPGHDPADAIPQPAATQPADNVAVCDQPGEEHELEDGDHEQKSRRWVARNRELRHHGDEKRPRL